MRVFTMGDIHGNHKAMLQCFERSGFNKEEDLLIQLGDVADGWHEVYECVEELLSIKNTIFIKGNHDQWFLEWIQKGHHPDAWLQGGEGTLRSYCNRLGSTYAHPMASKTFVTSMYPYDLPKSHLDFWKEQIPFYKDSKNNLFVHGGFNRHYTLEEGMKTKHIFWWDRDLFAAAMSAHSSHQRLKFKEEFKNIFIGHTQTTYWKTDKPMLMDRVINIDTGAGWNGKLTIMEVDTKEYWQSDDANTLYPGEIGRK